MKILLAEHHGFCYGVKRAVEMAQKSVGTEKNIYTLGPIIHNPQVVSRLSDQGVQVTEDLSGIKDGKVIIRSHGVGPEVYQEASQKDIRILDATCPHVKKAQQAAHELLLSGYKVVVIGERRHPEVKSIVEWTNNEAWVIETTKEAEQLNFTSRIGVVAQTTFASSTFQNIVDILATKCHEIKVERTICNATQDRQKAAIELARKVEIMIVVGGKNSANTSRLAELCESSGSRVYHIETAAELKPKWFEGVQSVGITAGASTPDWIIEEVIKIMKEFEQSMQQDTIQLEKDTVVQGKIVSVRPDEVFVDIGYKAEGIIPLAELAHPAPANAAEVANVGDVIDVFVVDIEGNEGNVVLSKLRADKIVGWSKLDEALETKSSVEVIVTEAVKGGIVASVFGLRGFIPASQIGLHFVEDLTQFINQILTVKVMEVDKEKNRIILSRRVILEKERREKEDEIFSKLAINQSIKGKVTRLADFGAFVDIGGGVEGLIHISDLSWERVKNPSEVVAIGDEVDVAILKIDSQNRKLSLGLKQVMRDPWFDAVAELSQGMVIKGTVSKIMSFGAFVKVKKNVEGLVHISEISDHRITNAADVLSVDQEVNVKILGIDDKTKRVSLSICQAQQDAERAEYQEFLGDNKSSFGVTLGEKFGHLFKHED